MVTLKMMAVFVACAAASKPEGSCGTKPTPADCEKVDWGTCGTACCKYEYIMPMSNKALMTALERNLGAGGADGAYSLGYTAEGDHGFSDLAQYKPPGGVAYIGTAYHQTYKAKYNDTVNMDIFEPAKINGSASRLTMFSISQIPGAYGDDGQNYKNIAQVIKSLGVKPVQETHIFGCDGSAKPEPPSPSHMCKDAQGRPDEPCPAGTNDCCNSLVAGRGQSCFNSKTSECCASGPGAGYVCPLGKCSTRQGFVCD